MNRLKTIWNYVYRHKYVITVGIFLLIIGVLDDENSLIQRVGHWKQIRQLNEEIKYYRTRYEEDSKALKELTNNPEIMEKVAREKYLMKKQNEDIYIFEEDLDKR